MLELGVYGPVFRRYAGSGVLYFDDDVSVPCTFDIVQIENGQLYCRTVMDDFEMDIYRRDAPTALWGTTETGEEVTIETVHIARRKWTSGSGNNVLELVIYCGELVVSGKDLTPGVEFTVTFSLANLEFTGTRPNSIEHDGIIEAALELPLQLNGMDVVIKPQAGYRDLIEELKASKGIKVTAQAVVSHVLEESFEDVRLAIDDLCTLLTLARGCRITWLHYDVFTPSGQLVLNYHHNANTKNFGMLDLIPEMPASDLTAFVEQAFPVFRQKEAAWQLRTAIDGYTDAKLEEDFLELRALKLVVVMEHLKGRFLEHVCQPSKTTILEETIFERGSTLLKERSRAVLQEMYPEASDSEVELMAVHAQGFNWYPFGRAITKMFCALGLRVNSSERHRFKMIRNRLVHGMEFDERQGSPFDQFRFLVTFVGRALLAVVEYEGHYYDWRKPPGRVGNSEMRVKMTLAENRSVERCFEEV